MVAVHNGRQSQLEMAGYYTGQVGVQVASEGDAARYNCTVVCAFRTDGSATRRPVIGEVVTLEGAPHVLCGFAQTPVTADFQRIYLRAGSE